MNLVVATVALIAGIFVWWLAARRLTTKSWEAQGTYDGRDTAQMAGPGAARTGLWVFLAVVTSFFALFITAYLMRMSPELVKGVDLRDWRPVTEPRILWANTVMLVLGSACMQIASSSLQHRQFDLARVGMYAGGFFAIAFLAGQWLAWRQLLAAGYYAAGNPANAFFYVLTGLHGLHLLGGLFVWARSAGMMAQGRAISGATQLGVELCTVYWHYLLVVWLVLFGLLLTT
ncbi:MAG: cytochrome c oxidase subunit 3 [Gammaproteobacteria bacterium]|nr:cytochrome c oxidase subunit 3 [Gammaproteobacteria bacterium]MDH4310258.1 cytochrome c oxidase subunit 3 [Gammaproteobacteria bacterium]MDH5273255.1 cytochrome c oxidase subunit 3 [Gammaproteobacteria bacterium]